MFFFSIHKQSAVFVDRDGGLHEWMNEWMEILGPCLFLFFVARLIRSIRWKRKLTELNFAQKCVSEFSRREDLLRKAVMRTGIVNKKFSQTRAHIKLLWKSHSHETRQSWKRKFYSGLVAEREFYQKSGWMVHGWVSQHVAMFAGFAETESEFSSETNTRLNTSTA